MYQNLAATLADDVESKWFLYAMRNARRPTRIAMPSLPAVNLGENEERFYALAVSDSWPKKHVSKIVDKKLVLSSQSSRRFVDGLVAGDLGGIELDLSEHELSFIGNHSVGWITRYESTLRMVDIIEIDPWAVDHTNIDLASRRKAHEVAQVQEQRLVMFSVHKKLHWEPQFENNLALFRLLAIDLNRAVMRMSRKCLYTTEYLHVNGMNRGGMGSVDEEVLLKSLGSITAKNKERSALAIAAKARFMSLRAYGLTIRNIVLEPEFQVTSKLVRCGVDGIYIHPRVPLVIDDELWLKCRESWMNH